MHLALFGSEQLAMPDRLLVIRVMIGRGDCRLTGARRSIPATTCSPSHLPNDARPKWTDCTSTVSLNRPLASQTGVKW